MVHDGTKNLIYHAEKVRLSIYRDVFLRECMTGMHVLTDVAKALRLIRKYDFNAVGYHVWFNFETIEESDTDLILSMCEAIETRPKKVKHKETNTFYVDLSKATNPHRDIRQTIIFEQPSDQLPVGDKLANVLSGELKRRNTDTLLSRFIMDIRDRHKVRGLARCVELMLLAHDTKAPLVYKPNSVADWR